MGGQNHHPKTKTGGWELGGGGVGNGISDP